MKHATVWDGAELLFEFNFQAFGIPATECFSLASASEHEGVILKVGKFKQACLSG